MISHHKHPHDAFRDLLTRTIFDASVILGWLVVVLFVFLVLLVGKAYERHCRQGRQCRGIQRSAVSIQL